MFFERAAQSATSATLGASKQSYQYFSSKGLAARFRSGESPPFTEEILQNDGWVDVQKSLPQEEFIQEESSLGVGFVKKFGSETFFIRFPEKPISFWEKECLVVRSEKGGEIFELRVQKNQDRLASQKKKKWSQEKIIKTEENVYQILVFSEGKTNTFFSSFSLVN